MWVNLHRYVNISSYYYNCSTLKKKPCVEIEVLSKDYINTTILYNSSLLFRTRIFPICCILYIIMTSHP